MTDVLLLGSTGMLGHAIKATLEADHVDVVSTARNGVGGLSYDVCTHDISACIAAAGSPSVIVNAIGIIKPHINEGDITSRQQAIEVNGLFPHRLALAAEAAGSHVIQIATDCVYSGTEGGLTEGAPHDPHDVYGKSKSLGEPKSPNITHIRCSIIGPEDGRSTSLWEWVLNQAPGASITGFTDHVWNGVTTQAFARLCSGIVQSGWKRSGTFHFLPADVVTKAELVRCIAHSNGRDDIQIMDAPGPTPIDRSISTMFPDLNNELWGIAGYKPTPTIEQMIIDAASIRI